MSEALNYENVEEISGQITGFCSVLNYGFIDFALQLQQTIRHLVFTPGALLGTFDWDDPSIKEIEALRIAFEKDNIPFLFIIGKLNAYLVALELLQMAQRHDFKIYIISVADIV
jgi:hypothetical protein